MRRIAIAFALLLSVPLGAAMREPTASDLERVRDVGQVRVGVAFEELTQIVGRAVERVRCACRDDEQLRFPTRT